MSNERNAKHLEYVMQGVVTESHRKALEAGVVSLRESSTLRAQLAEATTRAEKAEAMESTVAGTANGLLRVAEEYKARLEKAEALADHQALGVERLAALNDALAARVAELEGALECIPVDLINAIENGEKVRIFLSTESCKLIGSALARTPAQSLALVKAAALREAAQECQEVMPDDLPHLTYNQLIDMADRLEAEAKAKDTNNAPTK